jgi:hypothetical protein
MSVIRVVFGFCLACLAAAAALVLFVYTPAELAGLPPDVASDRFSEAALFALLATPHVMLFAALPALLCLLYAEGRGIASWTYYLLLGVALAVLGFLAQHFSEAPGEATILQNYALFAFLTCGVTGGLVYWLVSGRFAAANDRLSPRPANGPAAAPAAH